MVYERMLSIPCFQHVIRASKEGNYLVINGQFLMGELHGWAV